MVSVTTAALVKDMADEIKYFEHLIRVGGPAVEHPEQNRGDKVGGLHTIVYALMVISKMMMVLISKMLRSISFNVVAPGCSPRLTPPGLRGT